MQTWVINILSGSRRLEHSYDINDFLSTHPSLKKGISPDTISKAFPNTISFFPVKKINSSMLFKGGYEFLTSIHSGIFKPFFPVINHFSDRNFPVSD